MTHSYLNTPAIPTGHVDTILWTLPTLCQQLGLSRSSIYQRIQNGKFPEPIKVGRSSRWQASEIRAWIHDQANLRGVQ